ncbi:MAG: type VI secretion system domain-containing protein, partial [Desulfovermiculus sp.]
AQLPQDADEAGDLCKHALEQLLTYRDWVLNQDPLSPLAFRIIRWAAWSRIQSLPPAEGTATRIPPPETEILRSVHQLLKQSKFRQVLQETESRVSQYLFWLDLSWASAQALQGLGEDGAQALDALETETALFIRRFPGLGDLTFNDGTPFCSQHAWDWLHTLGRQSGSETEQRSDPVQETLAQAQNKAAQNDPLGALSHLEEALSRETGMRERLRLQIGLLRILGQDTPSQVGTAYSREIVAALDRFSLDFWEPGLALEGLEAAYAILRNSSHEESFDQARALFARMSRISPSRAMHWTDPK